MKSNDEFKGSDKFEKKYGIWKNNLLDMSHRNKQIYFNPSGTNTLEIFCQMEQLFDQLVVKKRKFRFPAIFEPSLFRKETSETDEEFRIRIKEMHRERIKEKVEHWANNHELITQMSDKLLDKLLKKLRRRSKNSIDEQGVNILYIAFGLLKWNEIEDEKLETVYSPLFFVPVQVIRKRVLDDFHLQIMDDDVQLNPSLDEKFKAVYNTDLPDFPEIFNLGTFRDHIIKLKEIINSKSDKYPDWYILERTFIGLFSFAKIRMFTDFVEYKEKIYNHPIVRAIAEGEGFVEDPRNLPSDKEYTDVADPQKSFHVIDCDSSQFKAITFAKKGANLVIRGPPGTGKSQTISNIIAECLSEDKKILFVSEKLAALEVVKDRLDKCGVGEFCLELHSQKANKVEVLKQLSRSLASDINPRIVRKSKYNNLLKQRLRLNEYIKNIHVPVGNTGSSLFQKIGEFQKFDELPLVETEILRPLEYTDENLFNIEDLLSQMEVYREVLVDYDLNPWKEVDFPYYEMRMKDEIYEQLRELSELTGKLQKNLGEFEEKYHLKPIENFNTVMVFNELFAKYNYNALELDPEEFLKYGSFVKVFNSGYRTAKKELINTLRDKKDKSPLIKHAKEINIFQKKYLNRDRSKLDTYKGIENDLDVILNRGYKIDNLKKNKLKPLFEAYDAEFPGDTPGEGNLTEWMKNEKVADNWLSNFSSLGEWIASNTILQKLKGAGVDEFVLSLKDEPIIDLDVPFYDLFSKTFVHSWIRAGMGNFSNLIGFNAGYHQKILNAFIDLDEQCIKINRYRLCERLFKKRPHQFWMQMNSGVKSSEYSILTREMAKKRNVKPLRKIIPSCRNFITKIKPCFMMSPLSVSKYLSAEEFIGYFDIVIFDEASQVCPEDAIGAILRGKQVIVVGDEKQLPPTRFFSKNPYDSVDSYLDDADIFDSILEECTGVGFLVVMLNYHYRSRKEGLIAFSNYHFYENNLITFPENLRSLGNVVDRDDMALLPAVEFNLVKNGIYDKGRTRKNKIEAKIVAEHIIEHYQNNDKNNTSYSLGIVALSEAQQTAIMNELEKLYKEDPELETIIGKYIYEPLFIKNLEAVQGDERDIMIFSIGYGKDKKGKMSINFGPINKTGGERRLNVAITRARYHVKIFCSFIPGEVDLSRSKSAGLHRLIEYLEYARTGIFSRVSAEKAIETQMPMSLFESSVKKALRRMGYQIDEKIGRSKFQIDMAVIHPEHKNRYILGITCDGGSYYRTKTARDRDRLRNQVLKGLGWNLYHIWSPKWYSKKGVVLKEIDGLIKKILKETKEEFPVKKEVKEEQNAEKIEQPEEAKEIEEDDFDVEFIVEKTEPKEKIKITDRNSMEFKKQYLKFPGVVEYNEYTKKNVLNPQAFNRKPSRVKAANSIIQTEGPIYNDLLKKRLKDYFGLKKLTKEQQNKMNILLEDTLENTDDFYFPKQYDKNLIRIELKKNDDPRKFIEISDLELKNALSLITKQALSIEKQDLFLKVLQLFGFHGRRKEYVPLLNELLNELLIQGRIDQKSIRDYEFKPESVIKGKEETTLSPKTEEIDMDKVMEEVDEILSDKIDEPGKIRKDDILEILDNMKDYDFDDLIDELDVDAEYDARELIMDLKQLTEEGKIVQFEKDDQIYYKMK
ncbi:MAG: DUF4011 domain-containing protein [Promethearchaeota archaeon]